MYNLLFGISEDENITPGNILLDMEAEKEPAYPPSDDSEDAREEQPADPQDLEHAQ